VEPLNRLICQGLLALELPADPSSVERWALLARLLERWNRQVNLTGHRDAEQIVSRLLLEAAAFGQVLPEADSIVDLGSGAGIPGIPIALCRPDTRVLLIESRQRRHHFQRAAVRELGLKNVEPLLGRAESLRRELCGGVVAQALKSPARSVEMMRPWLRPGGWLAIATTPTAKPPSLEADLQNAELRPYAVPGGGTERAAWLARLRSAPS